MLLDLPRNKSVDWTTDSADVVVAGVGESLDGRSQTCAPPKRANPRCASGHVYRMSREWDIPPSISWGFGILHKCSMYDSTTIVHAIRWLDIFRTRQWQSFRTSRVWNIFKHIPYLVLLCTMSCGISLRETWKYWVILCFNIGSVFFLIFCENLPYLPSVMRSASRPSVLQRTPCSSDDTVLRQDRSQRNNISNWCKW